MTRERPADGNEGLFVVTAAAAAAPLLCGSMQPACDDDAY